MRPASPHSFPRCWRCAKTATKRTATKTNAGVAMIAKRDTRKPGRQIAQTHVTIRRLGAESRMLTRGMFGRPSSSPSFESLNLRDAIGMCSVRGSKARSGWSGSQVAAGRNIDLFRWRIPEIPPCARETFFACPAMVVEQRRPKACSQTKNTAKPYRRVNSVQPFTNACTSIIGIPYRA